MSTERSVNASQIKAALEEGLTRPEIKEKFNLTINEMKTIFSNPKLKGLRTHKSRRLSFIFVDDLPEADGSASTAAPVVVESIPDPAPVAEEAPAPAPQTATRRSTAAIPVASTEEAMTASAPAAAPSAPVEAPAATTAAQPAPVTNNVETTVGSTDANLASAPANSNTSTGWDFDDDEAVNAQVEELDAEDDRPPFDR